MAVLRSAQRHSRLMQRSWKKQFLATWLTCCFVVSSASSGTPRSRMTGRQLLARWWHNWVSDYSHHWTIWACCHGCQTLQTNCFWHIQLQSARYGILKNCRFLFTFFIYTINAPCRQLIMHCTRIGLVYYLNWAHSRCDGQDSITLTY